MTNWSKRGILLVAVGVLLSAAAVAQSKTLSVQVKQAAVRSTPSFLGKIAATLNYGDQVTVLTTQSGWVQVSLRDGTQGWLHSSEVTEKQIALKTGSDVSSGASSSEVALAGKGFNEQVEQEYKSENELDYSGVDAMEKIDYSPEELVRFLQDGHLSGASGAAQ